MFVSHAEGDRAEDVRSEPLLSILLLGGLVPVGGSEVEDVASGPARQQAEEVAQVGPRFDRVQLAAGKQGDEGGIDVAAVVAAQENPVFATDRFPAKLAFTPVVVGGQPAVVEELLEGPALVPCVADAPRDGRFVEDERCLAVTPAEEGVHDGLGLGSAGLELCCWRSLGDLALDSKELSDQGQGVAGTISIRLERLPEVASAVGPAGNLEGVSAELCKWQLKAD
jgi:hypothetical protein